jgi:hypothetical protein
MKAAISSVLNSYLKAYRGLIAVEKVDGSTVLSFPLHLAASHRIEITVTDWGKGRYFISDSARTLGEIEAAGYSVTRQMKTRLEQLAAVAGARIVDTHLVLESAEGDLGVSIQKFLELSKTIGDVYLVHKQREKPDDELVQEVGAVLSANGLHYRLHEKIYGNLDVHPLDLVVPPNGHPGLAVAILHGQNTHTVAGFWYYRCDDIKAGQWYRDAKAKLALVYDVRYPWSDTSRSILESKADIALPSDSLGQLSARLKSR